MCGVGAHAVNTPSELERRVVKKAMWRLIPFLVVLYIAAFIDRVNVGFAALTMNHDLGIDPYTYGWAAGIFFLGYFVLEVPSNLMLVKFGARTWLARIMVSWGLISAACAFAQGATSFMVLRFILGAAEAGFFPGIIFFLTFWFPARYRARVVALFMLANPVASGVGSILSGLVLKMDGMAGLAGWQWLFIIEGMPSVVLGVVTYFKLVEGPSTAKWLAPEEREWLENELNTEAAEREKRHKPRILSVLTDPRMIAFGLIYLLIVTVNNGLVLWQPQILSSYGMSETTVTLLNALPFWIGAVAMVFWGRMADKTRRYRAFLAGACLITCSGLVIAALGHGQPVVFGGLVIAAIGGYCVLPVFWTQPGAYLTGAAAAAGIAFVNSVGNLGGFAGPYVLGYLRSVSPGFVGGLVFLAGCAVAAALLGLITVPRNQHTS
ncbi:MFS transporter, ACS family, tartrate transporter [Dyella sp. 333MFSha]|nr:MFS transporter, ACS family, tartrate transporter [Dyella sp. 333MFSha]